MLALKYLVGVVFFCGIFLLGKLIVKNSPKWADALHLSYPSVAPKRAQSLFVYTGRILEVVALVWGFLDAISVLLLAT